MLAPALAGISVAEYAPNVVKKSVVGAGHAEKDQVKHMVKVLLPRAELNTADFNRCAGHCHLPCAPSGQRKRSPKFWRVLDLFFANAYA